MPAAEKENARAGVKAYAPKVSGPEVWVRVNGMDTGFAEADLDAVIGVKGLVGVFLPKVESRDEVIKWDAMIGKLEAERGVAAGATKLVLSIESALGVLNAYDMALGAKRVVSSAFGGAQDGDLNTDLGCTFSIDGPEMMHARCHTLLCARAARFESPLDGVYANVRDPQGFEQDTSLSRRLGFRGRKLDPPVADRAVQPAVRAERAGTGLLLARPGGVRQGGRAGLRLDHGGRQDDRRGDGQGRPRACSTRPPPGKRRGNFRPGIGGRTLRPLAASARGLFDRGTAVRKQFVE